MGVHLQAQRPAPAPGLVNRGILKRRQPRGKRVGHRFTVCAGLVSRGILRLMQLPAVRKC
ncbi:MAG: hypothetical protein IPP14_11630 [Planctomycetes bacterium]|nr:hypothetical protein [Planctomycetota bacterium]